METQETPTLAPTPAPQAPAKEPPKEIIVTIEPKATAKPKKRVTKKKVVVEESKTAALPFPDYRKNIKLFNRWDTNIEVKDLGLKNYINLTPVFVPYTAGRTIKKQFWKTKKSIVERLTAKLMVAGHRGKKHYWTSNINTGKITTQYRVIIATFETIERKTKKNPVEVLVRALEQGTPREGVATIEYGGVRYPKAADMAPQRRVDLALRWMVQGAFIASRKHKKSMADALADEIMAAAAGDVKSVCVGKRSELERQAGASR
jgi:small subunit ribosomal protein S7